MVPLNRVKGDQKGQGHIILLRGDVGVVPWPPWNRTQESVTGPMEKRPDEKVLQRKPATFPGLAEGDSFIARRITFLGRGSRFKIIPVKKRDLLGAKRSVPVGKMSKGKETIKKCISLGRRG